MPKKPVHVVNAEINAIRRMMEDPENYRTDNQMMQELGIPPATFQRYKQRIYKQDAKLWEEIAKESLESRATKIMSALELSFKVNKRIALTSSDDKARIEASMRMVDMQVGAYRLLEKAPKKINSRILQLTDVSKAEAITEAKTV